MKKILSKFKKKREAVFPDAQELLSAVLGKKDLQELLSFCPDKRELFRAASIALGVEESGVLKEIGEKYSFSFTERVLPMDLDLLPEGVSLEHFKRIGAIGITKDHVLQGVVGVSPALIKRLFPTIDRADIILGSWDKIEAGLKQSEHDYIQKLKNKKEEDSLQSDLVVQLFDYIWQELLKHDGRESVILLQDDEISYVLKTKEEKEAKGSIHSSFAKGILHVLKRKRDLLPSGVIVEEVVADKEYKLIRSEYAENAPLKSAFNLQESDEELIATSEVDTLEQEIQDEPEKPSNVVTIPEHRLRKTSYKQEVEQEEKLSGDVLIVDDNKVFRDVLTKFLERKGFSVTSLDRADQAFHEIREKIQAPDLIVCDMHIPGMNGLSFVGKLRALDELHDLPVIMLSSDDTVETKLQCIGAGADLYLQKSEDPRLLCAHVARFISKKKSEAA